MIRNTIYRMIWSTFILFTMVFSLQAQTPFRLRINFTEPATGYIVYWYSVGGQQRMDTVRSTTGLYEIQGDADAPSMLTLRYEEEVAAPYEIARRQRYRLLLDGGNMDMKVNGYLADAVVSGAPLQAAYLDYKRQIDAIHLQMQPLNMAKQRFEKALQSDSVEAYVRQLAPLKKAELDLIRNLIAKDPQSPVSLMAVSEFNRPTGQTTELGEFFAALDPKLQQMPMGLQIKATLDEQAAPLADIIVPDFSLPDSKGVLQHFKRSTGKYMLIDFWASWCGPCRKEHPAIRKAYEDFHAKGFDIVSVSLDTSKEKWIAAIIEDQVGGWMHLSDLAGRKTAIASQLGITSIPFNLLLAPDGTVVAKNIHGLELNALLAQLLVK